MARFLSPQHGGICGDQNVASPNGDWHSNGETRKQGMGLTRLGVEMKQHHTGAWDMSMETDPSSGETERSNTGAWDISVEMDPSSGGVGRSNTGEWDTSGGLDSSSGGTA